jgi:hypothetical protein
MRLTVYTDYSLRMLMYLAVKGDGLATITEVADAYGISKAVSAQRPLTSWHVRGCTWWLDETLVSGIQDRDD